ncbi:MAG TPA: PAAR domain-containing protein [Kofleriaceae bacterium]|nr:PAAR domain-containing protein [Kofleriaceae bacterium]
MSIAARVGDLSAHGGVVAGPGVATVLIAGLPAAVAGDLHICPLVTGAPHATTPFPVGSATVLIGGRPALRVGDLCACGAPIASGAVTVLVGG